MKNEKLKSHFLQLYSIMLVDDVIDPRELVTLFEIGKRHGLSEEDVREIILSPASRVVFPESLEEKIALLYDMVEMAWADDVIQDSEKQALTTLAIKLGCYEENVPEIVEYLINEWKKKTSLETLINNIK